MPISA
jgi:DNA replication protein DnaC